MKTNPEVLKVLIALAQNLRKSASNMRQKETILKAWGKERDINDYVRTRIRNDSIMAFQARASYQALYNAYFIAKKAAGRKTIWS